MEEVPVLNFCSLRILLRGDEMGYRIAYQTMQKKPDGNWRRMRLPLLILLCFVLFLVLVDNTWQDGAAFLEKVLEGTSEVIPVSALNHFAQELRDGRSLGDSFAHFWTQIIS